MIPISCRSPHGERGLKLASFKEGASDGKSLPPRGAWIEISITRIAPYIGKSLPPRGAWIEIRQAAPAVDAGDGRSPHGERGLKSSCGRSTRRRLGRSPHGERGLKSCFASLSLVVVPSLPLRGAWIEMRCTAEAESNSWPSLPPRGAWIKIPRTRRDSHAGTRRSTLRSRIKIGIEWIWQGGDSYSRQPPCPLWISYGIIL